MLTYYQGQSYFSWITAMELQINNPQVKDE